MRQNDPAVVAPLMRVLDIEEHYAEERPGLPEGPRRLLREMPAAGRLGDKRRRLLRRDRRARAR